MREIVDPAWNASLPQKPLAACARVAILCCALVLACAMAQSQPGPGAAPSSDAPSDAAAEPDERTPALVSLGVAAGFPAYQTVAAHAGIQSGWIGAQLRGGYGPGAVGSIGAVVRGYPALPGLPLPVWLGAGAMLTSGAAVPFAAIGAHLPLAPRLRLDLEGGAAWTRLGTERQLVPHLQLGVSYVFAVTLPEARAPSTASDRVDGRTRRQACTPEPPQPARLDAAVREAERRFVADARATYGSLYRSLSYRLAVVDVTIDGDVATVELEYDGSVTEIASGRRVSAAGEAEAVFRWNGCEWRQTALRY